MCAKKIKTPLVQEFERLFKTTPKEQNIVAFLESKTAEERKEIGDAFMEYLRDDGNCARAWLIFREMRNRSWLPPVKETWELNAVLSHLPFAISGRFTPQTVIADFLCEESKFLDEEIWLIFEKQHRNLYRFNNAETGPQKTPWVLTFRTLVERGRLDRERLIDDLLKVFNYGYPESDTRWFVKLLQEIKPTVEEIKGREKSIYPCLENSYSTVSTAALDLLQTLDKKGMLDDAQFIEHCKPVLYDKSKPKILKAIAILERIAARTPALRERNAELLLKTLEHEAAEVQSAALNTLQKYPDMLSDFVREEIDRTAPLLAPSARLLVPGSVQDAPNKNVPVTLPAKKSIDRLAESRRLHPVRNHVELIDLGLKLFENSDDADEIELMYDGILRLSSLYPDDFDRMAAPLNKRFDEFFAHVNPGNGELPHYVDYRTEIFAVLRHWIYLFDPKRDIGHLSFREHYSKTAIKHWDIIGPKEGATLFALLLERNNAIFRQVEQVHDEIKKPFQLLSTPTHEGGLIDPVLFVERLDDILSDMKAWCFYDETDKVLAFCRIAEDKRQDASARLEELVKKIDPISDENLVVFIEALKFLLGNDQVEKDRKEIPYRYLWVAAKNNRGESAAERYRIESKPGDHVASLHLDSATHPNGIIDPRLFARRAVHWRKQGRSLFESQLLPTWLILNKLSNLLALDHRDEAVEILDESVAENGLESDDEIIMIRFALHGKKTLSGGLRGIVKDALAPRDPELPSGLSHQEYWQLKGIAEISNWARKEAGKPHTLKDKRFIHDAAPLPPPWEVWLVPTFPEEETMPMREKGFLYPYRNRSRLAFRPENIGREIGLQYLTASILPNDPAQLFPAVFRIYFDHEKELDDKDIAFPGFLQRILESDRPLDDIVASVLLMGMNSANQTVAMLDVDIMIPAIAEARLNGETLSKSIRLFLETANLKPSRLAKCFSEVAKQSPIHGKTIRQALDLGLFGEANPSLAPLLELLLELCIESKHSVESPECRKLLEDFKGSGKAAKLAKKLLEL